MEEIYFYGFDGLFYLSLQTKVSLNSSPEWSTTRVLCLISYQGHWDIIWEGFNPGYEDT